MAINYIERILGEEYAGDQNGPFACELQNLCIEMHGLLKDEKQAAFAKVTELSTAFASKYRRQICDSNGLMEFLRDVSLMVSVGHQPAVDRTSWLKERVGSKVNVIPHMLHPHSFKYYKWLGSLSSGFGDIVEIGCWMGATTFQLAAGLSRNNRTQRKIIHAVDSFRWDNNLSLYGDHKKLIGKTTGDDFLREFCEYTSLYSKYIIPHRHTFVFDDLVSDRCSKLQLTGSNRPIEYLIQDIAPDYDFNQYIWELFLPFFVDRKTLLVYGEYGNVFANSLRRFVRDYSRHLIPVHKVFGNVKAFLYRE